MFLQVESGRLRLRKETQKKWIRKGTLHQPLTRLRVLSLVLLKEPAKKTNRPREYVV